MVRLGSILLHMFLVFLVAGCSGVNNVQSQVVQDNPNKDLAKGTSTQLASQFSTKVFDSINSLEELISFLDRKIEAANLRSVVYLDSGAVAVPHIYGVTSLFEQTLDRICRQQFKAAFQDHKTSRAVQAEIMSAAFKGQLRAFLRTDSRLKSNNLDFQKVCISELNGKPVIHFDVLTFSEFDPSGAITRNAWMLITMPNTFGVLNLQAQADNDAVVIGVNNRGSATDLAAGIDLEMIMAVMEKTYKEAIELRKAGKSTEANTTIYHLAQQGLPRAEFDIGLRAFVGVEGKKQDFKEAFYWMERAAKNGYPEAQFMLTVMYFNGQGVPVNLTEFHRWSVKAAESGMAIAKVQAGLNYMVGRGVVANPDLAYQYFKEAKSELDVSEYLIELCRAHPKYCE